MFGFSIQFRLQRKNNSILCKYELAIASSNLLKTAFDENLYKC